MAVKFETALRAEIVKRKQSRRAKRLLEVIDGPKTKRRERILARLERHALVEVGADVGDQSALFDWSTVDWDKLFRTILDVLLKLLPLLL